jgi:hypothetical protein
MVPVAGTAEMSAGDSQHKSRQRPTMGERSSVESSTSSESTTQAARFRREKVRAGCSTSEIAPQGDDTRPILVADDDPDDVFFSCRALEKVSGGQRAELLRQRFKAKCAFAYVTRGRVVKPEAKPKRTYFPSDGFGLLRNETFNVWIREPVALRPVTVQPSRTKRQTALTRISRQLPMKLPVIASLQCTRRPNAS